MKDVLRFKKWYCLVVLFLALVPLAGCNSSKSTPSQNTSNDIIAFWGDSITAGLLSGNQHAQRGYPWWVGRSLNVKIKNYGHDGGKITGSSDSDLLPVAKKANLSKANTLVIAYGINDYSANANMDAITNRLLSTIQYVKTKYPKIKIMGILPQPAFVVPVPAANTAGKAMQVKNSAGYNENELCDGLLAVYDKCQVPVLDWRSDSVINENNVSNLTWDGVLHPNLKGYHIIGLRVAAFILQNGGV